MPSYMAFAKRACCGEGFESCSEGLSSLRFLDFLGRSFAFDTPLQTWVYTRDRSIVGLVAVKARRGSAVWEVDRWVGTDSPGTEATLESLLEHLAYVGGEEGIQKIFLRLKAGSPLLAVARRAGFHPYTTERVYRIGPRKAPIASPGAAYRARRAFDHQAIFQHFTRSVPARARQAEGLTLQEWRWLDGWQPRRHWQLNLQRGRRDYVLDDDGRIVSWLRIDARRGSIRPSVEPGLESGQLAGTALLFAMSQLPSYRPVYVPVREYQGAVEDALAEWQPTFAEEYTLTVRQLTVRVGERVMIPVGV